MVSEACRDLLIDAQQFSATFSNGLFNHLPMALVALDRLGADDARLRAFAASYSAHLRPKSDAEIALARTLRLGDALPRLSSGVASQAFHGLIRLAYAMDSGVGEEIPDALSAWMSGYSELPAAGAAKFETFAEALSEIAKDDRLPRRVDGRSISRQIANVVALPAFDDYRVADAKLPEIALVSARIYAATGDFTALHMVTGCHAMRVLAPLLGPQALPAFATAILAAYVTIGRPPLAERIPNDLPADAALAARAVPSDDDHDLKMVYSCLREEAEYGTGWHRLGAAVRLGLAKMPA